MLQPKILKLGVTRNFPEHLRVRLSVEKLFLKAFYNRDSCYLLLCYGALFVLALLECIIRLILALTSLKLSYSRTNSHMS